MNNSSYNQKSRFAMVGTLMVAVSLVFLFYMGTSMVHATKKYFEQAQGIELGCVQP